MRNTFLKSTLLIIASCFLTLLATASALETSLTIDPGPPQIGCNGDLITLGTSPLVTGGTAPYEITWYILGDTTDHTGLSDAYTEQPTFTLTTDVIYGVLVEDALGEVCSSQVEVKVFSVNAGPDVTYCPNGKAIEIGAQVVPDPSASYSWEIQGMPGITTGLNNGTAPRPLASPSSTTIYEITGTYNACSASDFVTVLVGTNTAGAGADASACIGSAISIGDVANPGTYTYTWSDQHGFLDNSTTANPNLTATFVPATNPYDIYLSAISDDGCIKLDTITITVVSSPDLSNRKIDFCNPNVRVGEDITHEVGNTYSWSETGNPGNTSDFSASSSRDPLVYNPGDYTVTVTNSAGCSSTLDINVEATCDTDPAECVVQSDHCITSGESVDIGINTDDALSFSWSPTTNLANSSLSETVATPSFSTIYTLTVNYTTYTCEYKYFINIAPTITKATDEVLCQNTSTTIGANGLPGWSYTWAPSTGLSDPNLTQPTFTASTETGLFSYIITGTNPSFACIIRDTIIIEVLDDSADAGIDASYCPGSAIILGSPAKPNFSYSWTGAGLDNSSIAQPTATPSGTVTYTLNTVNNVTGCVDSDMITLTEVVDISADAGGATTDICTGGSTQLGGADMSAMGYLYSWSPSTGLSDPSVANPLASPSTTTIYTLTVQNNDIGCYDRDEIEVTVNPSTAPLADAGTDQTNCEGLDVTIGSPAVVGNTYLWTPATGLNDNTDAEPTATVGAAVQLYTLRVEDLGGCVSYDQVLVSPVEISIDAGIDQLVCAGDSIQLGETAEPGFTYLWTPFTGLSSPVVSNPKAAVGSTQTYTLTKSDGATCFATDDITLTVITPPDNDAGSDQSICDTPISIGPAVPNMNYSYSWTPSTGLDDANIANPNVDPSEIKNITIYTLNVIDNLTGCTNTGSVTITPDAINQVYAPSVNICSGAVAIGMDAETNHTYSWSPSAGLSNASISNPDASPASTTTYTVTVTNTVTSCIKTATVEVIVETVPALGLADILVCSDSNTVIGVTDPFITDQFENWSWSPSTDLSASDVAAPTLVNPQVTRSYTVSATHSATGCIVTESLTVNVDDQEGVLADAGSDITICQGTNTTIGSTALAGMTYQWSPTVGTNDYTIAQPLVSPAVTTTYTLTVTNVITGCIAVDQVTVTVDNFGMNAGDDFTACKNAFVTLPATDLGPGFTYAWTPSFGMDDNTSATPTVLMSTPTTFTLVVTETATGCTASDQIIVDVSADDAPTQIAGIDQTICFGASVQLGPLDDGASTYSWTPSMGLSDANVAKPTASPHATTTYTLTASTGTCLSQSSVTITVVDDFVADAGIDQNICGGTSTSIGSASVVGLTYSWSPTTGLSDAGIANPTANPSSSTIYTVTVEDASGCQKSDQVTITVEPNPISNAGPNVSICDDGENVQIGSNPQSGLTYAWTPSTGLTNTSIANPIASPAVTTSYTLTTTDSSTGCVSTDMVMVSVSDCSFVCPTLDSLVLSHAEICSGETFNVGIYRSQNIESLSLYYNTGSILTAADIYAGSAIIIDDQIPVNQSVVINEITYWGGDTIELWNTGADTVDISSWWICSRFNYAELSTLNLESGSLNLKPGDYVVFTGFAFDDQEADVAIYSTNSFTSSAAMVDFIQYGNSGIGRESVAAAKGIWSAGTFINPVSGSGQILSYDGNGDEPTDWSEFSISTYFGDNTNKTANVQTSYSDIALPENNTGSPITYNIYAALGTGDELIEQCSLAVATTITVNPLPTVTINSDSSICLGDTAALSVSGGLNYAWTPVSNIDDATSSSPQVYPTSTTKYYVDVTDVNGCESRDSVTITILPVPELSTTDAGVCNGESIDLSTLVIDNNAVTGSISYYNSMMDATNEFGAITSTVSPSSTTSYFIRKNASSNPICSDIDSVTITIVDPPLLVANDQTICEGTFVDLSARISDSNSVPTGTFFYPTQLDADNQSNALGSTFVNPSITTTYYARKNAVLPAMCFDTEPITVTVIAFPDLVTTNDTICFGSSALLDTMVVDLNSTPGTFAYYNSLSDAQNATNAISATVSPLDTTMYYVRKTTTTTPPCSTIDSIKVYVQSCNFDIALKKTLSAGQSTTVNPGDFVDFDITVYNQGIVTAYDVLVTDYLDPNSTLADGAWVLAGMNATRMIDEIAVADSVVIPIRVQVNPSFMGLTIINAAEVSYATNIDGRMINIEDIDSNPNNTNGDDIGGTLNNPTQDDVVTDDGTIDEDDHDVEDVAVIQIFDLALNHTFTAGEPSSYLPGEIVSLDVLVTNEGTLNAYDISVINYDVPGLIYLDGGWIDENGYYSFEIPTLAAGASQTLTLRYTVDPQYTAQSIINNSEIAFATQVDGSGINTMDDDSTADTDETNNTSEDDFNSLMIPVTQGFDLALRKVLSTGQSGVVYPGDTVTFDIQVYNQGIEDAFEIVITDYLPTNTTLVSTSWTMNGSNAEFTISDLLIGQDTTVQVAIKVDEAFALDQMINIAELSFATDVDNGTILKDDQDSDFDTNPTDLGGGVNVVGEDDQINDRGVNDEDDHDPEDVIVCNIQINSSPTDPTCNGGADGSIDVLIVGGTAPYTYQWADGYGFSEDISGLSAGSFTISVTDANGCIAESNIVINDPVLFNINATTTNADCGMINGSITLNISGATPTTYDWDDDSYDGQSSLTGLTAGTFSVTVTDDLGCQKDTLINISSSSGLSALADERDISCEGADDGFIGLLTSGGTAPYTYDWSDNTYDGLDTLRDLTAGIYAVTVEDDNNCVFTSSFTITEPGAIVVDTAVQRLACAGDGNGIIDLFVTGGTEPYTYNWNNGLPPQQDQVGLSAGNFQYTVTDTNGCVFSDSVIINDPTEFVITATTNGPVCEGETLELTGTNGVSYDWIGPNGFSSTDPALTFTNATAFLSGTYTLRASNINACRDTIDVLAEVFPSTPTAILTDSVAICNMNFGADENAIDLNDLLLSGDMSGTWADVDVSGALVGSIFTATPSMADLTYSFSYTIAGSGTGECGDRVYMTKVHVNGCGFRLSLDKVVTVAGDLGDTVTYSLTVNNLGDVDAFDVVVKDHIPSGFTFTQGLNSSWTAVTGGVAYTFPTPIVSGGSSSIDIRLIIDANHQFTSITNTAEITFASSTSGGGATMDTNSTYDNFSGTVTEDDESSATLAVTQSYDLALNLEFIEGQSPELSASDPVIYYVIVSNEGTLDAFDVAVQFDFPIDLSFNAAGSTGWSDFGTFAGYTISNLPIGDIDTIPIMFNLISGSQTISAQVIAEIVSGSSIPGGMTSMDDDSTPNNAVPTEDDQDQMTIAIDQTYDLALALTSAVDSVDVGSTMMFGITISNQSTLPADDVTIVVYVPDGFTFPASMNPGWTAGTNGRYYYTFNGSIGIGLDESLTLSLIAGDNLLAGSSLNLSAEIVSGSFVTGGILLADSDGTFDDISSNDPSSEDNHDSILLYVRMGGCGTIVFNGATITGESCVGGDGAINLDIDNPSNYSYTWSPDQGSANADGNERTGLLAGRYTITITDNSDTNCFAELTLDVGYDCIPPIDIYEAYIPFNGSMEICMDDNYINLPKAVSSAVMCNDGSGTNPPAVIGSTTSSPECISLQAMNGYVGKFPEMLCVIHCTDDIVPICDTTLISITVVPQQDIETVQIPAGQPTTICLDPGVLQITNPVTANSVCDLGDASSVAVSQWDGTCVTLNPAPGFSGVSTDTICLVSCYNDDPRFCDTTYIVVEVTNAICPDYFDQSLIVQTGSDMTDMLEVTVDAQYFGFTDNYSLTNNGAPYTGNLTPTDYDSLRFYNVSNAFNTVSPPYAVTWSFNGFNFAGDVNNVFDLVDSMQVWDPAGNWVYNPILNQIETKNLTTTYGLITLDDGVVAFPVSINLFTNPQKTIIEVPTGLNVLVIPEVCPDTVIVAFSAPSPSEVYDTIFVNEVTDYCLDISELTTSPISVINYCPSSSGDNATITLVGNDPCIDLEGLVIGHDTACLVLTDEYGFEDTITYYLYVRDTAVGPPVATSDTLQLFKNQFANIPILMNDDTISAITTLEIIGQPLNGDATLNPDNTIRFVPDLDYCSDSETEVIQYMICNIDGCARGTVEIQVLCDELAVNNGFSPNGDGVNDAFYIDAALLYPNNELRVYNRWGAQVLRKGGYQNDWEGTWDGKDLPDGVYWYTFDTGEGQKLSGYVVLYRN